MSDTASKWIMVNGEFREAGEQLLAAESRAVHYGDGCFETLRSYEAKFLEFEAHLQRLRNGLEYLQIKPPFRIEQQSLKRSIIGLLHRNGFDEQQAVVRIQVWRDGARGFAIPGDASSGYAITVAPLPDIADAVKLATVSTRRIPAEALDPRYKLSNSINYIKAATEAARKSADDALMQTIEGQISETTIANIFWMKEGTVYTPSEHCDLLPGITRQIVLQILENEFECSVKKGEYQPDELKSAETAWICNSLRELVPIAAIDDISYATGHSFFMEVNRTFQSYKSDQLR